MKNLNNLTWFRLDQNTDIEQLYRFLVSYLPFKEVINLYKLLKKDLEVNYENNENN